MSENTTNDEVLTRVLGRLDALERDNHALRAEIAELRESEPTAGGPTPPDVPDQSGAHLSRRGVFKLGGAALGGAALAVGGSALGAGPAAADGPDVRLANGGSGIGNDSGVTVTSITGSGNNTFEVFNTQTGLGGSAVYARAVGSSGLFGFIPCGVTGDCKTGTGVGGISASGVGVGGAQHGFSTVPIPTIVGKQATQPPTGVLGTTDAAPYAVVGSSSVGTAVYGCAFGSADPSGGAPVAAVVGDTNSANHPAVLGRNSAGPGVRGLSTNAAGRGGVFQGGDKGAAIQLVPATVSTHPTSGRTGDLFVDKAGRLWFCSHGGAPATWKQLA